MFLRDVVAEVAKVLNDFAFKLIPSVTLTLYSVVVAIDTQMSRNNLQKNL